MARDINPELELKTFPDGLNEANLEAFLDGVDLYLDGLDFFALSLRQRVFAACARRGRCVANAWAPCGARATSRPIRPPCGKPSSCTLVSRSPSVA